MDGVKFDVHVRRDAGVADIRCGEIRIVLQLFQKVLLSFYLQTFSVFFLKLSK